MYIKKNNERYIGQVYNGECCKINDQFLAPFKLITPYFERTIFMRVNKNYPKGSLYVNHDGYGNAKDNRVFSKYYTYRVL